MDKMREEFELYCANDDLGATSKDGDGIYFNPVIDMLWIAWKASRAALRVELPEPWPENRDMVCGFDEIKEQLDKAGVPYK